LKKNIFLFIAVLAQLQIALGQITADKSSGCAPLTNVQFSFPTAGDWDFGDGGVAINESDPEASFSNPGVYNVTFNDGVNPEETFTITVFGKTKTLDDILKA
jgi:PKD repeat protein